MGTTSKRVFVLEAFLTTAAILMMDVYPAVAQTPDVQKDITYSTVDKTELKLDLVQPSVGDGPFPLIIWIHGGGWQRGDRTEYHNGMKNMGKAGYVSASIQYRFAPKYQFPAQFDDVRAALDFLRTNAKKYRIDPDRIGAIGGSAGGQLALLLGLAKKDGKPNGIKAVVSFAGPTDFRSWTIPEEGEAQLRGALKKDLNGMLKDYLGTSEREAEIMATASPATYVNAECPAVMTIHGTADLLVPFSQANLLHDSLKKSNVSQKLIAIEGGGHGSFPPDKMTEAILAMFEFIEKNVKGP